ncbi:MAG: hypothetical protein M3N46_11800 [Actinomycetota bacterium]|nr:hypothetical protein [Actinomycetota bacterium]
MSYTRLAIDPDGYSQAAVRATTASKYLETAGHRALKALSGLAHMGGDDEAGGKFARTYDKHAGAIFDGLGALCTALSVTAAAFEASAASHANAEAANTGLGPASQMVADPTPGVAVQFAHPASAYGGTNILPTGWTFIQELVSATWPDGDTGKMRTGKSAWDSLADEVDHATAHYLTRLLDSLHGFQAPDIAPITAKTAVLAPAAHEISQACRDLAIFCGQYADAVDTAHEESGKELAEFVITSAAAIGISILLTPLTAGVSDLVGGAAVAADAAITAGRVAATLASLLARVESVLAKLGELSRLGSGVAKYGAKFTLFAGRTAATTGVWTISSGAGDFAVHGAAWTPLKDLEYSVGAGIFGEAGKAGGELLANAAKGGLRGAADRAAVQTAGAEISEAGGMSVADAVGIPGRHRLPVGALQPVVVTGAITGSKSLGEGVGTVSGAVVGGAASGDLDPKEFTKDVTKDGLNGVIPILDRDAKHQVHFFER